MQNITSHMLFDMLESATNNLVNNKEEINELNVFPVPDGDTGTNMAFTLKSAFAKINEKGLVHGSVSNIMTYFSQGALLGARGNSGVITSQIFKGFTIGLADETELGIEQLAEALDSAKDVAYKSVSKPVEGTILTVIREVATIFRLNMKSFKSMEAAFEFICKSADKAVKSTPSMLPILAEVGVVDSGGYGLQLIFDGMYSALMGKKITLADTNDQTKVHSTVLKKAPADQNIGYCTEVIVSILDPKSFNDGKVKAAIEKLGDSLVFIRDEDVLKIHIHSKEPGKVISQVHKFGQFTNIKVDNMTVQVNENDFYQNNLAKKIDKTKKAKLAVIAVATGKGIVDEFKDNLGVDYVIEGGQTMNPSTNDFIDAILKVNAEKIVILPNNPNIILTAKQAADQYEKGKVFVVETKTVQQGIVATYYLDKTSDIKSNMEAMNDAIKNVVSGSVTNAVRNWKKDKLEIKKDDRIALIDNAVISAHKNDYEAVKSIIAKSKNKDISIIVVYIGKDAKKSDVDQIKKLGNEFEYDFEFVEGKQEVYPYLVQIELN